MAGLIVLLALSAAALGRKARAPKPSARTVIAPFILAKAGSDAQTMAAVTTQVRALAADLGSLRLLSDKELRAKLKRDPLKAITACGANLGCIAKLARRSGATEVLYGRAAADPATPGGVTVQFIVIAAKGAAIKRKALISVASPGAAQASLRASFQDLFGVPPPAAPTPAPSVALADDPLAFDPLALEPVAAPRDSGPATTMVSTAATPGAPPDDPLALPLEPIAVARDGGTPAGEDATAATSAYQAPASTPETRGPLASPVPAVPAAGVAVPTPWWRSSRVLLWSGAGSGGLGLIVAGLGGYYGGRTASLNAEIDALRYGGDGDTIRTGQRLGEEAAAAAGRANLLLALGSGLLVIGAGLTALDMLVLAAPEPAAGGAVAPLALAVPGGAVVGVGGRW